MLLKKPRSKVFGDSIEKKDLRALLKALRAGEVVVYSSDQNFNYQNAFIPFFGVACGNLDGNSRYHSNAVARSMLPFWFYRDDDNRYQITDCRALGELAERKRSGRHSCLYAKPRINRA